jgi:Uma2 family endonuclease
MIVDNVEFVLSAHIRKHNLGRGFGAETGFLLKRNPDTVRVPDFAFIAKSDLPSKEPSEAYWPGAPNLAVEVLSPCVTSCEVGEKVEEWLASGCQAVWIVDPKLQTVTIYQSPTNVR